MYDSVPPQRHFLLTTVAEWVQCTISSAESDGTVSEPCCSVVVVTIILLTLPRVSEPSMYLSFCRVRDLSP